MFFLIIKKKTGQGGERRRERWEEGEGGRRENPWMTGTQNERQPFLVS